MNIGSLKHSTAKKTQRQLKIYSNNPKHIHFVVSSARFLAACLDKTEKSSGKTWLFTWHSDQTKLFSRKQIDLNPLRVWKDWFWEEISLLVHLPPSLPPSSYLSGVGLERSVDMGIWLRRTDRPWMSEDTESDKTQQQNRSFDHLLFPVDDSSASTTSISY